MLALGCVDALCDHLTFLHRHRHRHRHHQRANNNIFAFNIPTSEVTQVAAPFGIPNTACRMWTYGGSCSKCQDETESAFTGVFPMANGSLVALQATSVNDKVTSGLSAVHPASLTGNTCSHCSDCSVTGGTCVCYCLPGCFGSNCKSGGDWCAKDAMPCDYALAGRPPRAAVAMFDSVQKDT